MVTGAASGLGRDAAVGLAREGARLVLLDRDRAGVPDTAARCPGAVCVVGDVSNGADVERAAEAATPSAPSRCS